MKDMHKTILRAWLVLWVVTLPLVHIHPEADHAPAQLGHVHGGTYHSILVNTPVYAHQGHDHEEHHHDGFFFLGDESEPSHSSSHPPYDFEEATYGFSIIKSSLDLESENSEYSHALVLAEPNQAIDLLRFSRQDFLPKKRFFSIIFKSLLPRAPPVLLI